MMPYKMPPKPLFPYNDEISVNKRKSSVEIAYIMGGGHCRDDHFLKAWQSKLHTEEIKSENGHGMSIALE